MNIQGNVASLLSFFLVLHLLSKSNAVSPCIYDLDARGVIDLTSVGRNDGTPMWKNVNPAWSDDHVYSYNPCHPFTQSSCRDVAACQTYAADENLAYPLGPQGSLQWTKVGGQDLPTLTYTSGERTLHVNLICLRPGEPHNLQVYGYEGTTNSYIMILSSVCACYGGCKDGPGPGPGPDTTTSNPKPGNGTTGGTIFIILLLVCIVVYVATFMAFNKFKRQATGLDILPHRIFWTSLPGYSLDGVIFVYRKVTGKSGYGSV